MKTHNKTVSVILAAVIVICSFPICGTAYAADANLPEQYDSRDYGYITPVRNQLDYGTCWAHGTIDVLDSTKIQKIAAGIIDNDFYSINLGDVDCGGSIDILDAVCIQKLCVNKTLKGI